MIEHITVSIPQYLSRHTRDLARARAQPIDDLLADMMQQALLAYKSFPNNDEDVAVKQEMQALVQLHPILKKGIDVKLKELFFTNSGIQNFCRARIADDDGS